VHACGHAAHAGVMCMRGAGIGDWGRGGGGVSSRQTMTGWWHPMFQWRLADAHVLGQAAAAGGLGGGV
jgi:hypothetical protein